MITHTATSQPDGHVDSLADDVREEIAAVLDLSLSDVQPSCQLRRDFGTQPHDFEMLRWAFGKRWGLFVPIEAPAAWLTVADVVAYVEMRQQRTAVQSPADRITG